MMKKWMLCVLAACFCGAGLYGATPEGWDSDFKAAQTRAKQEKKILYVLFTGSDWCPYCVRLQKSVLSQQKFNAFAGKKLVKVYLDFPRRSKADHPEQNRRLAKQYGVEGFPTAVLLTPDGKELTRIVGAPPLETYLKQLNAAVRRNGR